MRSAVILFVVLAGRALAGNGSSSTIPPYDPPTVYTPTKMTLYTEYCGLWRTDETYQSDIQLSNQLVISPIDATVTLFMADGTPYVLPKVRLGKAGVSTIDINTALANAPDSVRPHLSSFGSAAVSYKYDWQGVVFARMSILDIPRSLQYSYPFMFPMNTGATAMTGGAKAASTKLEALTWTYSKTTDAFLAFANTSGGDINVSMAVLDSRGSAGETRQFTIPAMNTRLETFRPVAGDDGSFSGKAAGGVRISFDADSGSLSVLGGIEDVKYGYSANIPLGSAVTGSPAPSVVSFASTGVMVGKQDAMMGFPSDLRFEPYAYFRNISDQPIQLTGQVYYGQAQSVSLPPLPLPPHQSRCLPLDSVINSLHLNGSVTLLLTYTGPQGGLLGATGAVDQTGNYVFAVPPQPTGQSASKSSIYWNMANGFDSMYSLFNPTGKAQDLLLTFRYGANQTYTYPVHLDAHAQAMVDLKQVAEMATLDAQGHVLPLSASEGSLLISAVSGRQQDPINVVISSGIYNPTTATCGYGCETCNGCSNFWVAPNPFSAILPGEQQGYGQCAWTDGSTVDYTSQSSWWTGDTTILTVQTNTDPNPGLTNSVNPGNTTLYVSMFAPVNMGQVCGGLPLPPCQYTQAQPSAPANVCSVTFNSANLTSDQIMITLSPSNESGDFELWEDTGSTSNYSQLNSMRSGGQYTDSFHLTTSTPVGQYTTLYAAWSACSLNIVTTYNYHFYNYGNTHHSQYTLINESTCAAAQANAYIITDLGACFSSGLQSTTLSSQFMQQTIENGTGLSNNWGYLKPLAITSCAGATDGKPDDANNENTFVQVPTVTGACNQALSGTTVAQYKHQCGMTIFIEGYGSPGTIKTVQDECPACANEPPHFDNWTNSGGPSCGANVTDLPPPGYFVTEQVQQ